MIQVKKDFKSITLNFHSNRCKIDDLRFHDEHIKFEMIDDFGSIIYLFFKVMLYDFMIL